MKIVYQKPDDIREFDIDEYHKSLNRYGEVSKEMITEELAKWHYDPMHSSCLVEIGVKLLPDEESARAYYNDHVKENQDFERLRRITGWHTTRLARQLA